MTTMTPRRKAALRLAFLAALAVGAFLSLLVVGFPQARGQSPALSDDEAAVLALINQYRSEHGLFTLKVSPTLTAAARWMSEDIADHNCPGHTDSLGRSPLQRMIAFGYTGATMWGEIIQCGADTPEEAFEAWRTSPSHNAVMLKAGTDGIKSNLTPPDPVEENIYTLDDASRIQRNIQLLPTSLFEALAALKEDKLLQEVLGEHLFQRYIDIKTNEWDQFRKQVTPWEIETYLDTF